MFGTVGRATTARPFAFLTSSFPEWAAPSIYCDTSAWPASYYAVLAQSALGNGAAYIALLVVAYERFNSAWAISLILLADFVPAMLFGPIFGAAADRWSRRNCLIVSDVVRGVAFLGIALVDSFAATVALACSPGPGPACSTLRRWPPSPAS